MAVAVMTHRGASVQHWVGTSTVQVRPPFGGDEAVPHEGYRTGPARLPSSVPSKPSVDPPATAVGNEHAGRHADRGLA